MFLMIKIKDNKINLTNNLNKENSKNKKEVKEKDVIIKKMMADH